MNISKTKLTIFLAVTSLTLFGMAGMASAADYYVSPAGVAVWANCGGATPLNGASACSWQTAMANAVAGDVVYFRGGNYDVGIIGAQRDYANMRPLNSGTAGNPITFIAYSGETPNITGTVTPSVSTAAYFGCSYVNYVTWDGFSSTLQKYGTDLLHTETQIWAAWSSNNCILRNNNFTGVDVGGWNYNTSFVRVEGSSYTTIENNYFHDLTGTTAAVNTTAIWLFSGDGTVVRNNTFYLTRSGISGKVGVSSANVYNNFLYNPINNACQDFFYIGYQGGGTTNGFNIYNNIIVGCTNGVRLVGIVGVIDNAKIYNNTIHNGIGSQAGIFINSGVTNLEVFNNIIYRASPLLRYYTSNALPNYSDYNNFYHTSSFVWNLNYATNYTTIESWRMATNLDTNSLASNPNFINPGGSNPSDYKRTSYPTNGRGGSHASVMGAYITGDEIIGYVAPTQTDTTPPSAPQGLVVN